MNRSIIRCALGALVSSTFALACAAEREEETPASPAESTLTVDQNLPKLGADIKQTSVSGVSAGGAMATQFHVAFSSIMVGAGLVAAPHYGCAEGNLFTGLRCLGPTDHGPGKVAGAVLRVMESDRNLEIDPLSNLPRQRVFLLSGAQDGTVDPSAVDDTRRFYGEMVHEDLDSLGDTDRIKYVRRDPRMGHNWPTLSYGHGCNQSAPPFLGNCDYDTAGKILEHIYGPLRPRASRLGGKLIKFDQTEFKPIGSQDVTYANDGYAYVPAACARAAGCRVHVFFHGCRQGATELAAVGLPENEVALHSGLNEWAENNRIIVLYPQVWATDRPLNPKGCWDWWGYTHRDAYAKRGGTQMILVKRMLEHLASSRD